MKLLAKYLALGAIAVILGSCSFAVGALNHKKARVVASAVWHGRTTATATRTARPAPSARTMSPYVAKSRALPARPSAAVSRSSRSVAPGASKDISASTDIDYITYTIVNLDPSAGEPDIQDYLDPYYPYIDVFLTPGDRYRITIDVALLPGSPAATAGAAVGISGYGDSADVAVPADGSDVWVDMSIHAMGIVFKNQIGSTTISYVDPTTGSPSAPTFSGLTTPTAKPLDKYFYTSDSLLYYFNYTLNAVYELTTVTSSPTFAAAFLGAGATDPIQIYAVCPDPAYPGWFDVVGSSIASGLWELYVVYFDPAAGPATWYQINPDITPDLDLGLAGRTISVTGITADPYGYAYVTFYNFLSAGGGTPVSGILEFDAWYGGPALSGYVPDTTAAWTSADSIFTDVMYNGSNLYVLASPTTSVGATVNTGTADVYVFDTYFDRLSANPSAVARSYNASVPALSSGSSLILPNKFTGMVQGGTFFLSQVDFGGTGGTDYLSAVSLDLSSVRSVP